MGAQCLAARPCSPAALASLAPPACQPCLTLLPALLFRFFLSTLAQEDPAELAHHRMMKEDLNHVLLTLTERECGIIKMRYGLDDGEEKTLEEVGRAFNVSGSRAARILVVDFWKRGSLVCGGWRRGRLWGNGWRAAWLSC